MRRLKILLLAGGLLLCLVIGVSLMLPATQRIDLSVHIDAPPQAVFARLNALQDFRQWSPWIGHESDLSVWRYGVESGVGIKMYWISDNPAVRSGSCEIIESEPERRIRLQLEYKDGGIFGYSTFTFQPEASGTHLSWSFEDNGQRSLLGRYVGLLQDRRSGTEYERGLGNLKRLLELAR